MEKIINGTAVSIKGRGVLLLGKSGSGKSDLALRLIDRGAKLISDDRVVVEKKGSQVWLKPHPEITGKLEVRGVGIVEHEAVEAALGLVVRLDSEPYERLPDSGKRYKIMDAEFPEARLDPFEGSSPIKLEMLVL